MNKIVKAFRMAAIAVCLATTLNACANLSYQKAGGTAAEWQQVQASCQLEAARQVPHDYAIDIIPGFSSTSESCGKHGCTTTSTFTPPEAVHVDQNVPLRDQVTRGCFARRGWTLQPK
jgi:hypothetical protein